MRDAFNVQKVQWENEKTTVEKLSRLREQIEDINRQIQTAQQNYDLDKARSCSTASCPDCASSWKRRKRR